MMAKILVVDDDPDFCEIVRMVLSAEGHTVEAAANGDMALKAMHASRPDLLLLDVMMAGVLDGVQVARIMSEDAELSRIPLIMISSIVNSPMADRFPTDEYLPIDDWITKPVQPEDLATKVDRLLTSARAA
jgi:CheY-like chemotaxis protein